MGQVTLLADFLNCKRLIPLSFTGGCQALIFIHKYSKTAVLIHILSNKVIHEYSFTLSKVFEETRMTTSIKAKRCNGMTNRH